VNRTRKLFTSLIAMIYGSVLAQQARADIRPPLLPAADSGPGTVALVSIVAAIIASAAIAGFVLVRRKKG